MTCDQHEGMEPVGDRPPACVECGKIIYTRDCEECGETFIKWDARGSDSVASGPWVTMDGMLCCIPCGRRHDRKQMRREAEEARVAGHFDVVAYCRAIREGHTDEEARQIANDEEGSGPGSPVAGSYTAPNAQDLNIPSSTPPSAIFWQWVERLINKYLCPRPDAKPLWLAQWWYNLTGRIEAFCHRQYCEHCSEPVPVD